MTQRRYAVLLAFALCTVAAFLSGCGATDPGSASFGQNQTAKADVTIAAVFPTPGGAVKSLIPAAAKAIQVYAQKQPVTFMNYTSRTNPYQSYGTLIATLTPTASSQTVQLAAGQYMMYAIAFDSADPAANRTIVGQTTSGGEILANQSNTIILTFMEGQWTVVDAADAPSSIVLSNGTALNDIIVVGGGGSKQPYKAGKSAIDYTKPVGYGGGNMRVRFSGYTSARTYGGMMSQFIGTTTTTVHSSGYNLTKKCSQDGSNCPEGAGDQIVMISGKEGGSNSGSTDPMQGSLLTGSPDDLLPSKGMTTFTNNGVAFDLNAALPDTIVTGGNLITGAIVEWKPATAEVITLGTPAAAKRAGSAKALAVKAQSTNTAYTGMTVKYAQPLVCSGTNPQNRGTWTFANNTSAGKVAGTGSKVCYSLTGNNNIYLSSQLNPATGQYYTSAGDYSYGLVPTATDYGDYCHVWDYRMYLPFDPTNPTTTPVLNPNYNKACLQQLPGSGEVYQPWNFRAIKTATKTAISYGSFKFNFWGDYNQTGAAYIYPFRAKGSTTITPAR